MAANIVVVVVVDATAAVFEAVAMVRTMTVMVVGIIAT